MGVVKTASESVFEEVVVPSEEANYSVQGHAGKFLRTLFYLFIYFLSRFLSTSFYSSRGKRDREVGGRKEKTSACPALVVGIANAERGTRGSGRDSC
ncbi:hypothetical protein WN51_11118 [Melipona quadrifasciata]|uniref:Uncharacterized protein n=1 Tax=Melipona quadrifasciata TaxID=166423 RepID=A0A0N0BI16_9HYME|nr:hypothetical protein WN51_11118 [Melipona quadrifasciata]